uniref:Uncharacterized protein n=1 Tax=Arundo donax TaxID=35708 RepID=A0A0A9B2U0_ARUDO
MKSSRTRQAAKSQILKINATTNSCHLKSPPDTSFYI